MQKGFTVNARGQAVATGSCPPSPPPSAPPRTHALFDHFTFNAIFQGINMYMRGLPFLLCSSISGTDEGLQTNIRACFVGTKCMCTSKQCLFELFWRCSSSSCCTWPDRKQNNNNIPYLTEYVYGERTDGLGDVLSRTPPPPLPSLEYTRLK